jgi:hypothetical protein
MRNGTSEFRPEDIAIRGKALHIGGSTYAPGTIAGIHLTGAPEQNARPGLTKATLASIAATVALGAFTQFSRAHADAAWSALGIISLFAFLPFVVLSIILIVTLIVSSVRRDNGRSTVLTIVFTNGNRRGARGTQAELEALKAALEGLISGS